MRKRRGSAVVTILAVSMVLMLLGGILLNVIMSTTKGNEDSNRRQDLKYGAEGGLEVARSYLAKNGYKEVNDGAIETEINKNAEILTEAKTPESNVTKMEIELNPLKDDSDVTKLIGVEIVSKAKYDKNGKNNEEELKMKYKIVKGHDGNFLDNGIVGGRDGVDFINTGTTNLDTTSVSSGKNPPILPVNPQDKFENDFGELTMVETIVKKNEHLKVRRLKEDETSEGYKLGTSNEFALYKMNGNIEEKIKMVELELEIDMTKVENERIKLMKSTANIVINSDNEYNPKEYIQNLETNDMIVLKFNGLGRAGRERMMNFVIINSTQLEMDLDRHALLLDGVIILNSGETNIYGNELGGGTLMMNVSTIVGKRVHIDTTTSVTITEQPNEEFLPNGDFKGGVITKEQEKEINKFISVVIPNWSTTNVGGKDENLVLEGGSYE